VFSSSYTFCISFSSKSTLSDALELSSKTNLPHVPDVPKLAQSDLLHLLSKFFVPEIATDLSAIFPAKYPNSPNVSSFGSETFIATDMVGESSFRRSEYGLLPVIALARAENALSLFVFRFPTEFA
jgi:hypothetical protein